MPASGWVYAVDNRLAERPRRAGYGLTLSPRYRVSDKLNFRYTFDYSFKMNQVGYVNDGFDDAYPQDQLYHYILGSNVLTLTNTLAINYTFTNRLSLTMRTRHYVSTVHYHDFARLAPRSTESALPGYQRTHDNSYNAFNVDAALVWWFAPGSQVSLVWENAQATFLEANEATPLYFDNLRNPLNSPHNNVSVKVLYYLDYLNLRRRRG